MKPVLQALILAEHVYEEATGKKIIVGTFNAVKVTRPKPPEEIRNPDGTKSVVIKGGQAGSPYAYISLTDVCDPTMCGLQFVSLKRNKVLFKADIEVSCSDRLATVEIVAALPHLDIPEPGTYALELVCEGEILGSLRIQGKQE